MLAGVVLFFFAVAWFVLSRVVPAKKKPASSGYSYTAPGKRR